MQMRGAPASARCSAGCWPGALAPAGTPSRCSGARRPPCSTGSPPSAWLIAALGGGIPRLDPWYLLIPLFLLHTLVRIVAHVGEEIGWRGYALPRLQARIGPLAASVLIGLLAGLWHLPAFFIVGHPQYGTPILPFIVWMVAIAIVFTWVYNHSGGSLLPVTLLHAAINGAGAVFPALPLALDVGVTLIAALAIVADDRQAFFARRRVA